MLATVSTASARAAARQNSHATATNANHPIAASARSMAQSSILSCFSARILLSRTGVVETGRFYGDIISPRL